MRIRTSMYRRGGYMIHCNNTREGESIEQVIQRVTINGEPVKADVQMYYTERKQGVLPQYDIRTDRFEIALQAMDKVAKSKAARRDNVQTEATAEAGNE